MYRKPIRITALILLILTTAWVVLMAITSASIEPDWTPAEYARWAAGRGPAYILCYVNASLLTLLVLTFLGFLLQFFVLWISFKASGING